MQQSPWEGNSYSASQKKLPHFMESIHHHIHIQTKPVLIYTQINPVHSLPFCLFRIHFNNILLSRPKFPQWFLSFRFPDLYAFNFFAIHDTFIVLLILHDLILSWCDSPLVGLGLLLVHKDFCCFKITHNDTPQSVGLFWTSDELVAETSTWQHTTLTTDKHPWLQWDSNPRSQQASGRRPTP